MERPKEFALKTTKVTATQLHPELKLDWAVENSTAELITDSVVVLVLSATNTSNTSVHLTSAEVNIDYHDQNDCLLLIPTLHIADESTFDPDSTKDMPLNTFWVEGPGMDNAFVNCNPDKSDPDWVQYLITVRPQPHSDGRGSFLIVPPRSKFKFSFKAKLGKPGDYKIYIQEKWPKVSDDVGTDSFLVPIEVPVLPH